MPIIKDRYGNDFNTEYKFSVQLCFSCPSINGRDRPKYWTNWSKYKTLESCLQGLRDLKIAYGNSKSWMSTDGGKTKHKCIYHFRPIHYYPA